MQISTRGRYALRVLLYLADCYQTEYITVATLSKQENISAKYLEHIMSTLVQADFVTSIKGSKGGYRLSEPPETYTVGKILRLMENGFSLVPCVDPHTPSCQRYDNCTTVEVWKMMQEVIDELIDNLTLVDLLRMQQEKLHKPSQYLTWLLHHEA